MPATVTLGPRGLESQFSGATETVTEALERNASDGTDVVRNVSAILTGASGGRVVEERMEEADQEGPEGPTLLHSMMQVG